MSLDAPPEWELVSNFKGSNGPYLEGILFRDYIERLKRISVTHDLDREFLKNFGSAMNPYTFGNVPRAVVEDTAGKLELLVEAYDAQSQDYGNGMINIYSIEPERAKQILGKEFFSREFGEPTPLISKITIEDGVPAEDVIWPLRGIPFN